MTTVTGVQVTAEQYALGILRRHRDSMTRPDFQQVADDSTLTPAEVEQLWERLLAGREPKPLNRPRAAAAPSPQGQNAGPRPVEAHLPAWMTAKDHASKQVRAKYLRAVKAVAEVEAALAAEAERDRLREKEARLAAQLAKVRAELRAPTADRVPCPVCGKTFAGAHGLVMHRTRTGCGATT